MMPFDSLQWIESAEGYIAVNIFTERVYNVYPYLVDGGERRMYEAEAVGADASFVVSRRGFDSLELAQDWCLGMFEQTRAWMDAPQGVHVQD